MDYKKILEGVVNIINATEKSDIGFANICTYIGENCPELKESEDERIRKALLELVHDTTGDELWVDYNVHKEDAIAWLEKQGEQKPMKTCAEYYNQDNELKMPELSEFQDKLADILMYREYDGPDETEDDIAKGRLEYELAAIRLSEELLPLAQKEQKPAWSEEDENRINRLIAYFEDKESFTAEDDIAYANWLKSLKPQNRWKPSDEQMDALDAFIEKACEWIKMMWSETDDRFKKDYTEMLVENFKNYMKEE